MFKLTSLNLNGIRSATTKGLEAWMNGVNPDCICVQEVKAQAADVEGRFEALAGLNGYFHFAQKKGYSGVGVYTRHEPSEVIVGYNSPEFDLEGRYVELRFDTPSAKRSIISCYFPSGSSGDERQQAKYRFLEEMYPHLQRLKAEREFVLCGDINIAHHEIDLKNFKGNRKNSGFLPEERAWMTKLLDEAGMVDVYRSLHPTTTDEAYTWWSNRGQAYAKNVGWRLDYHLATPALAASAKQAAIYKGEKVLRPCAADHRVRPESLINGADSITTDGDQPRAWGGGKARCNSEDVDLHQSALKWRSPPCQWLVRWTAARRPCPRQPDQTRVSSSKGLSAPASTISASLARMAPCSSRLWSYSIGINMNTTCRDSPLK